MRGHELPLRWTPDESLTRPIPTAPLLLLRPTASTAIARAPAPPGELLRQTVPYAARAPTNRVVLQ